MAQKTPTADLPDPADDPADDTVSLPMIALIAVSGISAIIGEGIDDVYYPSEDKPGFMLAWRSREASLMPFLLLSFTSEEDLNAIITTTAGDGPENVLADRLAGYCARRGVLCEIGDLESYTEVGSRDDDDDDDDEADEPELPPTIN